MPNPHPYTLRFRSRHLHATLYHHLKVRLDELGWVTPPINFGTGAVTTIDYQPDERNVQIKHNTVAISLGNYSSDEDEELGAALGGARSAPYQVFVDVYMAEQALSLAICDDIRDIFTDLYLPVIDQITDSVAPNTYLEIAGVHGPEKPAAAASAEQFKRYWRTMRLDTRMYFNT